MAKIVSNFFISLDGVVESPPWCAGCWRTDS